MYFLMLLPSSNPCGNLHPVKHSLKEGYGYAYPVIDVWGDEELVHHIKIALTKKYGFEFDDRNDTIEEDGDSFKIRMSNPVNAPIIKKIMNDGTVTTDGYDDMEWFDVELDIQGEDISIFFTDDSDEPLDVVSIFESKQLKEKKILAYDGFDNPIYKGSEVRYNQYGSVGDETFIVTGIDSRSGGLEIIDNWGEPVYYDEEALEVVKESRKK
jgi:hypothetical protein